MMVIIGMCYGVEDIDYIRCYIGIGFIIHIGIKGYNG
jgi:hypothetical protein